MSLIKIGFCVAYDWEYLKISLPRVYASADKICLSIDMNRVSWSGKKYEFKEEDFFDFIKSVDTNAKIDVYEDDFYLPQLSALENDTRQRQLMATRLGFGGWHLQIDSDEYFLNFESFIAFLKSKEDLLRSDKTINVCCFVLPIFKKLHNGFLIVKNDVRNLECFQIATNRPCYEQARRNGHYNYKSPYFLIHQTWARSEEEVWSKINGWGHDDDFKDKSEYYKFWLSLNELNYKNFRNFHPIHPKDWEQLQYIEGASIGEVLGRIEKEMVPPISKIWLNVENSKLFRWLRQYIGI